MDTPRRPECAEPRSATTSSCRRQVFGCGSNGYYCSLACELAATRQPKEPPPGQQQLGGVLEAADYLLTAAERFDRAVGEGRR